jgi:hypothetical protein
MKNQAGGVFSASWQATGCDYLKSRGRNKKIGCAAEKAAAQREKPYKGAAWRY